MSLNYLCHQRLIFSAQPSPHAQPLFQRACLANAPIIIDNWQEACEAVAHDLGIGLALENDIKPDPRFCSRPIAKIAIEEPVSWLKNRSFIAGVKAFGQLLLEIKANNQVATASCCNAALADSD